MLIAIFSAFSHAGLLILDKIILSKQKATLKIFLPITFIFLFIITALLFPFLGRIDTELAFLPNALFLLFIMLLLAIGWNVLYYQSVQQDKVHHHEMLQMFAPLFTIILAAVFFPDELDGRVFILALIASAALLYAKSERQHYMPSQVTINTMLGVLMMATESIVIRELLYYYSPVALYAIRTGILALFFLFYYRPILGKVKSIHWRWIAVASLVGAVMMITRFYAFSELGVIFTTLLAVMAPMMVFLLSWQVLHEKIKPRVVVAGLVVVSCVAYAAYLLT